MSEGAQRLGAITDTLEFLEGHSFVTILSTGAAQSPSAAAPVVVAHVVIREKEYLVSFLPTDLPGKNVDALYGGEGDLSG